MRALYVLVIALLCFQAVSGQIFPTIGSSSSVPPLTSSSSSIPPSSSSNPPSSSSIPPISSSSSVPVSSSSSLPSSTPSSSSVPSTSSQPSTSTESTTSSVSSNTGTSTPTNKSEPVLATGAIVGIVVGGIVGLALLGGIVTWLNRRGGCTSKTRKRRPANFDEFGLAERDFPHHRSPAMANAGMATPQTANKTLVGSAAAAASPTLPRMNDQGNYYGDYPAHATGYEQYHDGGYYYPQDGGYYDENGYYYDAAGQPIYDQQPQHQQQAYAANPGMMAPLPPTPSSGAATAHTGSGSPPEIHKPDAAR
ncbi:hypothetical protein BC940DRAFT_300948 [Gongronella butleri]|nr:hypothetical protein BC940DRAFT_300948 [Gongronella butleri]